MTRIELFIPTTDVAIEKSLEKHGLTSGVAIETAKKGDRGFDASQVTSVVLTFGSNVAAGLVAAAIYDSVKDCAQWIRLNRRKTAVEPQSIVAAVEDASRTPAEKADDTATEPRD